MYGRCWGDSLLRRRITEGGCYVYIYEGLQYELGGGSNGKNRPNHDFLSLHACDRFLAFRKRYRTTNGRTDKHSYYSENLNYDRPHLPTHPYVQRWNKHINNAAHIQLNFGLVFAIDWNSLIANTEINKKIINGTWNQFPYKRICLPAGSLREKFLCSNFNLHFQIEQEQITKCRIAYEEDTEQLRLRNRALRQMR